MSNELYEAIYYRDLGKLKYLVESEKIDVNQLSPPATISPLATAVKKGYPEIVSYLIQQKADVNAGSIPPIHFIADIWCEILKKQIIRAFLKIPELKLNEIERKSLRMIMEELKIDEVRLDSKENLTHLGIYLFYFKAVEIGSNFVNAYKDQLDINIVNNDENLLKGTTLGWQLGNNLQYALCKNLTTHPLPPIELNAAPLKDEHDSRGLTIALQLAFDPEFEVLEQLSKNCLSPVNLNAMPLNSKHYQYGITLAWELANNQQWDLLNKLYEKFPSPIDLNVRPLNDYYALQNTTLAWMLAYHEQFDLLNKLCEKCSPDLTAMPSCSDDNTLGSITFAELLITKGQFELFFKVFAKYMSFECNNIAPILDLLVKFEEVIFSDEKNIQSFMSKATQACLTKLFAKLKTSTFKQRIKFALENVPENEIANNTESASYKTFWYKRSLGQQDEENPSKRLKLDSNFLKQKLIETYINWENMSTPFSNANSAFLKEVSEFGFIYENAEKNGNGFFQSIADQLLKVFPEKFYQKDVLRNIAIEHLLNHQTHYEAFMGKSFETLIGETMSHNHCLGRRIILMALSHELNVSIIMISSDQNTPAIFKKQNSEGTLYLGCEANRYQSLHQNTSTSAVPEKNIDSYLEAAPYLKELAHTSSSFSPNS
jgi:hypothetical protein